LAEEIVNPEAFMEAELAEARSQQH
jgi:hypothetical protein